MRSKKRNSLKTRNIHSTERNEIGIREIGATRGEEEKMCYIDMKSMGKWFGVSGSCALDMGFLSL